MPNLNRYLLCSLGLPVLCDLRHLIDQFKKLGYTEKTELIIILLWELLLYYIELNLSMCEWIIFIDSSRQKMVP